MARIIKSNTPKIRRFELHPAAKPAIDFFHSIPPQFHFLPTSIRRLISYHSIVQGVICDDRFLMFDPVWSLRLWESDRPPADCQLIGFQVDEISDEQIIKITWANTLNIVFSSIDKSKGLLKLHESLNRNVPVDIKQQFGLKRAKISERELAQWANVSPGTIPEQRRQQAKIVGNHQGEIFGGLFK
jgi:hypothetical protein